jgi:ABC-2 type transport system ATP-binding protein
MLKGFSKGMKQKTAIARALLHDPELLIMDEPVSSLDPYGIREVRDIISEEHQKGRTIFISSHILSEIERTCTRVGIMKQGRLLAEDEMNVLKSRLATDVILEIELQSIPEHLTAELSKLDFVKSVELDEKSVEIRVKKDFDYRGTVSEAISNLGGVILGLKTKEMTLEEAFVTITEQNIDSLAKEAGAIGA